MSNKEIERKELFKSIYESLKQQYMEEHKKLLELATQLVDNNMFLLKRVNHHHNISDIQISEMLSLFRPVICPLTSRVIHMDSLGYLWPCLGCMHNGNLLGYHEIYYWHSILHDYKSVIQMREDPTDDPYIPAVYKDSYKAFTFHGLNINYCNIMNYVANKCGGHGFSF